MDDNSNKKEAIKRWEEAKIRIDKKRMYKIMKEIAETSRIYQSLQHRLESNEIKNPQPPPHPQPPKPPSFIDILSQYKSTPTDDEAKQCIVCHINRKDVCLGCGHTSTCVSCTLTLLELKKPCPLCRAVIKVAVKMFEN